MKPFFAPLRRLLPGLLLGLTLLVRPAAAEPPKLILTLGDDSYIPAEAVKATTGAETKNQLGERDVMEFAVIVLSNIPYGVLPPTVKDRLPKFLSKGGSLLITGGPNSFGSGGYQPVASVIPFEIRAERDWIAVPFKAVIPLQPDHPILQGVTFRTVGNLNDMNPRKSGATEIARYSGGGTFDLFRRRIGSTYPFPLIAEQRVGHGTVLGVAFDLGREIRDGWADGTRFVQNILAYLVQRSPLKQRPQSHWSEVFSEWQDACDRKLRRDPAGTVYWESTAADCRRELTEVGYPYTDLVDSWLAERLIIAKRVERGELFEDKGDQQINELNRRIHTEAQQRQERTH